MPVESDELLAGLRIPNLDRLMNHASQTLAVRAERQTVDRTGVPLESDDFLAVLGIPNLKPTPKRNAHRAGETFSVRAEGHTRAEVTPELRLHKSWGKEFL